MSEELNVSQAISNMLIERNISKLDDEYPDKARWWRTDFAYAAPELWPGKFKALREELRQKGLIE